MNVTADITYLIGNFRHNKTQFCIINIEALKLELKPWGGVVFMHSHAEALLEDLI